MHFSAGISSLGGTSCLADIPRYSHDGIDLARRCNSIARECLLTTYRPYTTVAFDAASDITHNALCYRSTPLCSSVKLVEERVANDEALLKDCKREQAIPRRHA